MSITRLARNPIAIPSLVNLKVIKNLVSVSGKLGELEQKIHPMVLIHHEVEGSTIRFSPINSNKVANALTGTMTALVKNMIRGVSEGFQCKLLLVGVGYRAIAKGDTLNLTLGFSHPVNIVIPKNITVQTPSQTEIILTGSDKQAVFQMGANIRAKRPPEPYKGKGIRYYNELIVMKEVKKK